LWLSTAVISHYSSLAAAIISGALVGFIVDDGRAWLIGGAALFVILRHHENIRRLIAGAGSRIEPPYQTVSRPASGLEQIAEQLDRINASLLRAEDAANQRRLRRQTSRGG
jgi:hypothetical protein